MISRRLFNFLLCAVVLLAVLSMQWVFGERRWVPPSAQLPELAVVHSPALKVERRELDGLSQTLERPLFVPGRRPPSEEVAAAMVPEAQAAPDVLDDAVVLGVFGTGTARHVMLRSNGKVLRLREDDPLGDWVVRAFGEQTIIFMRGQERRELELKHAPAPAAPAAASLLRRLRPNALAEQVKPGQDGGTGAVPAAEAEQGTEPSEPAEDEAP